MRKQESEFKVLTIKVEWKRQKAVDSMRKEVSMLWGIENAKEIAPLTVAIVFVIHCTQLSFTVQGGKQNCYSLSWLLMAFTFQDEETAEASILTFQDEDLKT